MANTGVLPFVRGVDFTSNDFSVSILLISIVCLQSDCVCRYRLFQGLALTLKMRLCHLF